MNRATKAFLVLNTIWLLLLGLPVVLLEYTSGAAGAYSMVAIQSLAAIVLLLGIVTLAFRLHRFIAGLRVLLYIVMLGQGVLLLFAMRHFFSLQGILAILMHIALIVYLIGFRGFLVSRDAEEHFN